MKKLMIAAAIVCAAVVTQAASIDWAMTGKNKVKAQDGTTGWNNQTVYLVLDSQKDAIIAALNAGNDFTSLTLDYNTTGSTAMLPQMTTTSNDLVAQSAGGDIYNFMLLMVDTTSDAGNTWYRFSGVESQYAYQSGVDDANLIQFVGADFQAVSWTKASGGPSPIPEPTSAMLLLLGVAGLALKRKQA